MATFGEAPPPADTSDPKAPKKGKKAPQEILSDFWDKFNSKKPGKVTSIFPRSLYKTVLPPTHPDGERSACNAADSYEAAAKDCRERIERIKQECYRTNEKFTDPDFDIEHDYVNNCLNGLVRDDGGNLDDAPVSRPAVSSLDVKNCLDTLAQSQMLGDGGRIPVDANALSRIIGGGDDSFRGGVSLGELYNPGAVHRVDWIFENPKFTVSGYSSSDIKQGANGDCWWLAAVATIAHRKDLMEKVCVARDEECGVYGFVFQRDGEWVSVVVDDNLYLSAKDFDYYGDIYDATGKKGRKHRRNHQTGSDALYFARCEDANETWLPLLEKAYAKVHGDYEAISGGWPGEGVEDMTGGVTTTLVGNRVLDKNKLWKELKNSDSEFVFALAAMGTGWDWQKNGLALGHAYSILQAREEVDDDGNKIRLVQIRNPWGERSESGVGEWNGPWSDGSKEWSPYWLKKFEHTFGDDGVFWMSYKDMLETFMFLHRTRLFDKKWTVVQQWASTNITWVTGYLQIKFEVEIKKTGPVVIVLTQLDDRYFKGFEGEYYFELHFLLKKVDTPSAKHICRVRPVHKWENRSVSCEINLESGKYEVLPQITATRQAGIKPVEEIVQEYAEKNPQKLRQVGMQYDLAHAKGGIDNEDKLLETKKSEEQKKKQEKKSKRKAKAKKKKALEKAAEAMASVAVAMKELTKDDGVSKEARTDQGESQGANRNENDEKVVGKQDCSHESAEAAEAAEAAERSSDSSLGKSTPSGSEMSLASTKLPATSSLPLQSEPAFETQKEESGGKDDQRSKKEREGTALKKERKNEEKSHDEGYDSVSDSESELEEGNDDDQSTNPWNAVAVIGLRVYACDPDVSISLRRPTQPEDTAVLTIAGKPVGATI